MMMSKPAGSNAWTCALAQMKLAGVLDLLVEGNETGDWLGDRDYLEGRFTAGDLMMATPLRILRHANLVGAGSPPT